MLNNNDYTAINNSLQLLYTDTNYITISCGGVVRGLYSSQASAINAFSKPSQYNIANNDWIYGTNNSVNTYNQITPDGFYESLNTSTRIVYIYGGCRIIGMRVIHGTETV